MMFEISSVALAALGRQSDRDFVVKLARFLHENVPALSSEAPADLVAAVSALTERARGYGLTTERSIAVFALTAAYLGLDFDTAFPPATAVLSAQDMTEAAKARWLEDWTTQLFEELA